MFYFLALKKLIRNYFYYMTVHKTKPKVIILTTGTTITKIDSKTMQMQGLKIHNQTGVRETRSS